MASVELTIGEGVAELRLNNPQKLNALTTGMLEAIENACDAIERDASARILLLTAAGDRAFCAGADIEEWSALSPDDFSRHWIRYGHRVFDRLANLAVPTIGVLHGDAMGGGLELAATTDIRVMHPKAKMALPEARIGVIPGWSGTQRLSRLLPRPVVRDLALFGRELSAERAFGMGFVSELSDEPHTCARQIADEAIKLSPRAQTIAKAMLNASDGAARDVMVDCLGGGFSAHTTDKVKGVEAFSEKRILDFSD